MDDRGTSEAKQKLFSIGKCRGLPGEGQPDCFSIYEDHNSILSINPNVFVDYHLKKNDILICKDSNVGEVVLLCLCLLFLVSKPPYKIHEP